GTSTRAASLLPWPTFCTNRASAAGSGGASIDMGNCAKAASLGKNEPSFQFKVKLGASRSAIVKSRGIVCLVSTLTRVQTPHDGPLAAMLTSRLAASGVKFVGKLAITSTRYASATSPAARLYSSIDL